MSLEIGQGDTESAVASDETEAPTPAKPTGEELGGALSRLRPFVRRPYRETFVQEAHRWALSDALSARGAPR